MIGLEVSNKMSIRIDWEDENVLVISDPLNHIFERVNLLESGYACVGKITRDLLQAQRKKLIRESDADRRYETVRSVPHCVFQPTYLPEPRVSKYQPLKERK